MSFDAGSVAASLTIDTGKFDSELDRAKAKVKAFEDERHTVKISAVFDSSATARARQTFAKLDQQLTADALARMRTSPQGSVLGSLNALLAPQSQSLQQGSLGNITGNAGRVSTAGLPASNTITTEDRVNVTGLPDSGGTITTTDKVVLDKASAAQVEAELDAIGAKKETVSVKVDGAATAATELAAVSAAEKDAGSNSQSLRQRLSSSVAGLNLFGGAAKDAGAKSETLGEQLGVLGEPMGALVAAGVALSPVIVTAGVGLAGFGGAAVGAVKPILDAAQATGGLQGNLQTLDPAQQQAARGILALEDQYDSFSKALAPEVFSVFNAGLKTASTLLHDVEPVAESAGKGLDSVINAVNADLHTSEWQNFFGFMAKNAGPDIQMVGSLLGALANELPPLLESLQPIAEELITTATAGAKAVNAIENLPAEINKVSDANDSLLSKASDALNALGSHIPAGNRSLLSLAEQWLGVGQSAASSVTPQQKAAEAQKAAVTAATDLSTNLTTLETRYGLSAAQAQALVTAAGQTDKALEGSGKSADGALAAITKYADASLNAASPSQQLAAAIGTLDNNTLGATAQLTAFTNAWNVLVGNSVSDQQAVLSIAQAFDSYNSAVKQSGRNSTAAQTAFLGIITSMGSGLSTLQQNGATVDQINGFYKTNIDRLNALHGLTPQQQADVQAVTKDYSTWANTTDGLNNKLLAAAGTIQNNFTAGLKALGEFTPKTQADIDKLSNSILKTGTTSSATRGDRAALIADLERAGIDSDTAAKLVNALEKKIAALKGKKVDVNANVNPAITALRNLQQSMARLHDKTVTVTVRESDAISAGFAGVVRTGRLAAGGRITAGTGPTADDVLVRVSKGETVVSAATSRELAPVFAAHGVPGYASGGVPGGEAVLGYSLNSGRGYVLGGRGSDMATPVGGTRGSDPVLIEVRDLLRQLHTDNREIIQVGKQAPSATGRHVGGAINGAAADASFRSRYPRGGV